MVITLRAGATLGLALALSWARPQDVLILRDGTRLSGEVRSCNDASCRVDAESVPRARIVWVGFGQAAAAPPAPRNLAPDEVHLVTGEVVSGDVVGLSLGGVLIGEKSFDREEVAWVRFAGPEPMPARTPSPPQGGPVRGQPLSPAFGPARPGDQPGAPPSAPPLPSLPPTPPPSMPPPPPPGGPPPGGCGVVPFGFTGEPGGRWIGSMDGRVHTGGGHLVNTRVDVRLRECRYRWKGQLVTGLGEYSKLVDDGSIVKRTHSTLPSHAVCTYSGEGTSPATGERAEILRSVLAVGPGRSVTWSEYTYVIGMAPDQEIPYTKSCPHYGGSTHTYGVSRRGGWSLNSGNGRQLPLTGGRMVGSYSESIANFTTWSICREGTACPSPPELPEGPAPDFDPCGRAGQKAALRDTCRAQLDALLDGLAPALAEYNEQMRGAEANREAFQKAQQFCELYDKATEILEAIVSGGAGPAAEVAQSLVYLRDVIAKVQSGELASLLYPEQLAEYLGYYEKAKAVWFEVTADEISKMRRKLEGCSGKVPIETYLGAKKFIEHFSAAKQVWNSKVAPGLNDLRSKGLECAALDHEAWRECLEDAACRGVPPACGPEPSLSGAYDRIKRP